MADERDASTLASWIDEMAGYIKQLDSNHLVSTGSEGFAFGPGERYDEVGYWMNTQGSDFVRIHESSHIDVASMHLYPDHWQISSDAAVQFIRDRARDAAETLNKPVYNGEFGKRVDRNATNVEEQLAVRNRTYQIWYETMAETGMDGAQFWQLVPNSCAPEGDVFTVLAPDDEATLETITAGAAMLRDDH
jgi:mannan endo-1,4-beta-mannosidase